LGCYNLWYQELQVNHDEMVTTRNNPNDNVPNFEAMINAAVANALPNLTAALRTQITNDIRNGARPSGGGGGDAIPHGIHVLIKRFTKLKLLAFRSAATPVEAEDWSYAFYYIYHFC
nr:zinc finger, CCHC-type, retrotransposon Gag domain protein [Tanacetum cinerariifolium]